jgi:UrcA family protein
MAAAGFIGLGLTAAVTADAKPRDIVVEGKRFDPETQRRVSYADLNLAFRPQQKVLMRRISTTARVLCDDLGYAPGRETWACTSDAVHSTDDQVAAAIERAELKMAGKPVGPAIAISMVVGSR